MTPFPHLPAWLVLPSAALDTQEHALLAPVRAPALVVRAASREDAARGAGATNADRVLVIALPAFAGMASEHGHDGVRTR